MNDIVYIIPAYCCMPLYACDSVSMPPDWLCPEDDDWLLFTPLTPDDPKVGDAAAAAAAAIIFGRLF